MLASPPHIGGIAITDKYASFPDGSATRGKASNRGEGGQDEHDNKAERQEEADAG